MEGALFLVPDVVRMPLSDRRWFLTLSLGALVGACAPVSRRDARPSASNLDGGTPEMRALVDRYAREYGVPPALVHRVVQRESRYNPAARNGPYLGLMQILPQTAQTMGYKGPPSGLLDAETNLKYGVKYLRGAWLVADGSHDRAVMWYSKGYYYEAKRRGLLQQTGLRA
jgi:soluble lytic murein transglycosylase-like protein